MNPDWKKSQDGLLPAVVQDISTGKVLMLGYFNQESLDMTLKTKKVTFFSRSRGKLWIKGETSGNYLELEELSLDCDNDSFLVMARPTGPTCHRGTDSCFSDSRLKITFLPELEEIIRERFDKKPEGSYVTSLIQDGLDRMAQKVGEEAVETIIAAKNDDLREFEGEAADLIFHLMVLLEAKGSSLASISELLHGRHR